MEFIRNVFTGLIHDIYPISSFFSQSVIFIFMFYFSFFPQNVVARPKVLFNQNTKLYFRLGF